MNLVSKEFVACQSDKNGVLILSEMTGAASELSDALLINPIDMHEMADSIDKALGMPMHEKDIRIKRMQNRIKTYDIYKWADDFLKQVHHIKKEQKLRSGKLIDEDIANMIKLEYNEAKNRIILFDYDGTLVPFRKRPEMALIDKPTLDLLNRITKEKKNQLFIVSGRERKFLEKQFKYIRATLIAEHGYYTKPLKKRWIEEGVYSLEWKDPAKAVLQKYVQRCNGTFIEEKKASLAWHYRNAEDDYINLKLLELKDELSEMLKGIGDLTILEGKKVIEIKGSTYNKGTAVNQLIDEKEYDFILAVGDDKTDEDLFASLPKCAITIKIGREPSLAKYCLKSQKNLLPFLENIIS
jgi:trehalose 6-phosphate synthase/phosphatase